MASGLGGRPEEGTRLEATVENRERPFAGKVGLVTGGNRGLGAEVARELARQGAAAVVLTSRTPAEAVLAELEGLGTTAHWIQSDLSDPDKLADITKGVVKETVDRFGSVDTLINNAGTTVDKYAMMMKPEHWYTVMRTNLDSAFFIAQQAYRQSMRHTGGSIVNVSSVAGEYGNLGQANYVGSKAGLIGITKGLSLEFATLAKEGKKPPVTVNAVCPGFFRSQLTDGMDPELVAMVEAATPMGKLVTTNDVAMWIVRFADPRNVSVTGEVIDVDGGLDGGIRALAGIQQVYNLVPKPPSKAQ